jgi:hypothetical protein
MENGGAKRTTQLLRHIVPKKLTHVIRLIGTSSLFMELRERNYFELVALSTNYYCLVELILV